VTDHLLRDLAPIPAQAWHRIDEEARRRLTTMLVARQLVDWVGSSDWRHDAMSLGHTAELDGPPPGVSAAGLETRIRRVLPLTEFRIPFTVSRREIEDVQRGAPETDFEDLNRATRFAAAIENRAVLHGWPAAGISGIAQTDAYPVTILGTNCDRYPSVLAHAVEQLRRHGIGGPYALAINPDGYTRVVETTERGGYSLFDHLQRILAGRIVWTPDIDGAVLISQRGGDFLFDVGQDLSIGYVDHDADSVHLYLEESFTFGVAEPDAGMALS
jgi:uncharacterized linocin/CFP29 family protein